MNFLFRVLSSVALISTLVVAIPMLPTTAQVTCDPALIEDLRAERATIQAELRQASPSEKPRLIQQIAALNRQIRRLLAACN
jgi:uncharacterized protein involved in exopolysaccharide biosynthesis